MKPWYRPPGAVTLPFTAAVFALFPLSAHAAAVQPGAGSILQQVQPKQPPASSGTSCQPLRYSRQRRDCKLAALKQAGP